MLRRMLILCFAMSICVCTLGTVGCGGDKGAAVEKSKPSDQQIQKVAPRKKMMAPPAS